MSSIPDSPRPGLMSHPEPGSEQQSASPSILRSCNGCSSRKVRCDKKEPCSTCTRTGKVCTYPPGGPRKRRTKKTIIADMAARISSLEKSASKEKERPKSKPSAPSSGVRSTSEGLREEVVVQKGSSTQYFNEILLSTVIEGQDIKAALTPPNTGPLQPQIISPFNAHGILSSPSLSIVPSILHPPQDLAVKLWKIYVDNVESCVGLKFLHLPTDDIKVYSTINDPTTASLENLALCYAVYFASAVSMDESEAAVVLAEEKNTIMLRFKVGLEQALAHSDFLDRPTITGLCAFAIYLSAVRIHNHGKGIWILNGLAIRIAQSLGLHRNGEKLGLSPFESEVRRRIWWHLLCREWRSGEDYGLENMNNSLLMTDVGLPINVEDKDLYPKMQKLPAPRNGWTDISFSLICIDLAQCMQKIGVISASSSPSSPPSESLRAQIIKETKERVDKWLAKCNPVLPPQRLALFTSTFLLRKYDFVTRLQWILLRCDKESVEFVSEENLVEALEILESRMRGPDGLLKQFSWIWKAFPQYHVTMYVLWHLSVKPEGPNIDRAWATAETMFSPEIWDETTMGFGSKSAVLTALRAKAVSVREKARRMSTGKLNESGSLTRENLSSQVEDPVTPTRAVPEATNTGEIDLEDGMEEWPDWEALVENFQFNSSDTFWQ